MSDPAAFFAMQTPSPAAFQTAAPGNKSLFASFSSEKEESSFFSEEKNQKTFVFWRLFEDTGLGRDINARRAPQ